MKLARTIAFRMTTGLLAIVAFAQSNPDASKALVITGHVLTSTGEPASDVNVHLTGLGFEEKPQETAMTDSHGVFTFSVALIGKYRISPGSGFKGNSKIVNVGIARNTDSGNFNFERCPAPVESTERSIQGTPDLIGDLTLNQIIIDAPQAKDRDPRILAAAQPSADSFKSDSEAEDPQCWFGLASMDNRSAWEHLSMVNFEKWVTIEIFVGGRVNAIHVLRLSSDPPLTQEQIKEQVRKVWLGSFRSAASTIGWSEGNPWNIEAKAEFDDGKQTSIWMDPYGHVQVQDRKGKYWFLRLWPAA